MPKGKNYSSLIGTKKGSLTVLGAKSYPRNDGKKTLHLVCACDCGNEYYASPSAFVLGRVISCGCSKKQRYRSADSHGMSHTRFYKIWCGILKRCNTKTSQNYINYGGRGIKVCDRWMEFNNFKEDMYQSYLEHVKEFGEENTSIERKDVNGNYDFNNCTWATRKTQNNNSRQVKKYHWKGKERSLSEIAEMEGINYRTLRLRFLYNDMPLVEAVTPKQLKKRRNMELYDYKGERLTITEIARREEICNEVLRTRIKKKGMTLEEALSTPIRKRGK